MARRINFLAVIFSVPQEMLLEHRHVYVAAFKKTKKQKNIWDQKKSELHPNNFSLQKRVNITAGTHAFWHIHKQIHMSDAAK